MSTNKILGIPNVDQYKIRETVDAFRPEVRDMTPSVPLGVLLGVVMIGTQPEFRGNGDPRPALIPTDTAAHIRKVLESNGVDVNGSIDRALNRTGATA
jgi:hypothetical protein